MKKKVWLIPALSLIGLVSCQKANEAASGVTLTASTTQATVGQTVSVQLSSNRNASSWTVTPSSSVTQSHKITTANLNYFTFNQAGTYTVGVRVRNIAYDSAHQSLDSCWHHGGGDAGGCKRGVDSASVSIKVI